MSHSTKSEVQYDRSTLVFDEKTMLVIGPVDRKESDTNDVQDRQSNIDYGFGEAKKKTIAMGRDDR